MIFDYREINALIADAKKDTESVTVTTLLRSIAKSLVAIAMQLQSK